jgi:hypothetical protein
MALSPRLRLTTALIHWWADAYHRRHGRRPTTRSGPVAGADDLTWEEVDRALRDGGRGLPGGSSLGRLLDAERGVPQGDGDGARTLDVERVVQWAQAHQKSHGRRPTARSGAVDGAPGESWRNIDEALRAGMRGLPGGDSLYRLLAGRLGPDAAGPKAVRQPPWTEAQVLRWADAFRLRHGRWPGVGDGAVDGDGTTWRSIDAALRRGHRGLPGGSSLARLLARGRGRPSGAPLRRLTVRQILAWADAHIRRTGRPPTAESGPIPEAPGETWSRVNNALARGTRGLAGGDTLDRLLFREGRR